MNSLDGLRRKLKVVHSAELFKRGRTQSCGVVAFDECMNGGLPEGKVIELYGDWASGKSLLVYHAIVEMQKAGGIIVLVDTEDALNAEWARIIGIDLENLIYISPINTEEEVTIEFVFKELGRFVTAIKQEDALSTLPALFVWDSVAATKSEEEDVEEGKDLEYKPEMALRARVIGQMMRKIPSMVAGTRIITIFVNQLRDLPGVRFGKTEETPGGRAIKFHAHLRLSMRKGAKIMDNKVCMGVHGRFFVDKSKVGRPFREANFHLTFDKGIPKYSGLKDLLVREGRSQVTGGGYAKIGEYRFREINDEVWAEIQGIERRSNERQVEVGENVGSEGEEG